MLCLHKYHNKCEQCKHTRTQLSLITMVEIPHSGKHGRKEKTMVNVGNRLLCNH